MIDDWLPDPRIGAGAPRALALMQAIIAAGAELTLFPTLIDPDSAADIPRLLGGSEVVTGYGSARMGRFLSERGKAFDLILISRPHNMTAYRAAARESKLTGKPFIYDSEALFARREALRRGVLGDPMPADELAREIRSEIALADGARMVITVTEDEAAFFRASDHADVRVLGYSVAPTPGTAEFDRRSGFLFVGPFYADGTPNTDSIVWFLDRVVPNIRRAMARDVPVVLAGLRRAGAIAARVNGAVRSLGALSDLAEVYAGARVFVAPTRFAAGIPIKVYDAAAHGVPVVLTPLLAEQLGWRHEQEALVADSAEDFAAQCVRLHGDRALWEGLRARALARIAQDCEPRRFSGAVSQMLREAV